MSENKNILCYDLLIQPEGSDIEDLLYISEKTNYLFYDSFNAIRAGCPKPYPYMIDGSKSFKILIDISTEKGKKIHDEVMQKYKKDE